MSKPELTSGKMPHANKNKMEPRERSETMKKQQWKLLHLKPEEKKGSTLINKQSLGISGAKACLTGVMQGGAQDN